MESGLSSATPLLVSTRPPGQLVRMVRLRHSRTGQAHERVSLTDEGAVARHAGDDLVGPVRYELTGTTGAGDESTVAQESAGPAEFARQHSGAGAGQKDEAPSKYELEGASSPRSESSPRSVQ